MYLARLENDYYILAQKRPIFAKPSSRQVRYYIADNFLSFWFRFVYKYQNFIESGNIEQLRVIIHRDYSTFSGLMLERYFRQRYVEEGQFTCIGGYWNRKGEDEIDLVAVNEMEKRIEFVDIKRSPDRIDIGSMAAKAKNFLSVNSEVIDYEIVYKGLSMGDM